MPIFYRFIYVTKINRMKKVLIIIACLISVSFGEKSQWYLKLYEDDQVILMFPRNEYKEAYSLLYPESDTIYSNNKTTENIHAKRMYLRAKIHEYNQWELTKDTVMVNKIKMLTWN